jgi:hypothetical protein
LRKQKQQEEAKLLLEEEVKKTALATLEETLKNHYDIERETMPAAKLQTKSLLDYAKLSGVTYTENRKELLRYFAHKFHLSQDPKKEKRSILKTLTVKRYLKYKQLLQHNQVEDEIQKFGIQ